MRELKALRGTGAGGGGRAVGAGAGAVAGEPLSEGGRGDGGGGSSSGGGTAVADGSTSAAVVDVESREVELWEQVQQKKQHAHATASVPDGPIVSHVNIDVEVVGSNFTWDSCLLIDRPKARERELAKIDAKSTSTKSFMVGLLNPMCHTSGGKYRAGEEKMTPVTTACPEGPCG